MSNSSRRIFIARSAAAGAVLAGSGLRAARAQSLTQINIAAIPSDISGSPYYAADQGFFKQAGLDAQFLALANGPAITAAVLSGSADVGYSNVISLALAHARGLPITILFPANMHVHDAPTAGLLSVKKTSPIAAAKDLDGKVMAVIGLGIITDIAARYWIDKNGGDSKTVKSVELPFSEMKAALESDRIDAAVLDTTGDPLLGKPGDTLRLLASTFDAVALRFAPSVWFTTNDWVAKHPAQAKAFVTAMRRTAQWANTHHAESAVILSKYVHLTPAQIDQFTRVTYGDHLTAELIQPNIDVAVKYGVINAPIPAADLISSAAG
ncbi:MAG: ABC transporter substrate-binding protein [Candidatus Lustribacter sp.]